MKRPWQMTDKELTELLNNGSDDEELLDEAYDEVERRERDKDLMDWTEQDERARNEELYQRWREEY